MLDDFAADSAIFFDDFGHDATYSYAQVSQTCHCQIQFDVQTLTDEGLYVTCSHAILPTNNIIYRVGATLTIDDNVYELHKKIEDDGFKQRWMIEPR